MNPRDEPEDEPRETPSFEPPPLRGQVAEEARHRLRMLGLALTGQAPEPAEPAEEERFEEEEETVEEYAMRMAEKGLTIARTARGIQDHWAYSESHAKRIARAAKHEFLSKGSADGDRDD
ncbi:hypothetical protein [Catenuloplanes sp. NPDC020197]|uniref:hypothetical protein n=1 Tax=Catenuloplanes sp. NPDC020197 TaxID=3363958 RepID=UPI0037A40304